MQFSLDEVVKVVEEMGFEFLDGEEECGRVELQGTKVRGRGAGYQFNSRSLGRNGYEAQSWVVRKML